MSVTQYHQVSKECKMNTEALYPFNEATLKISPMPIEPPIYQLTVDGETRSLDAVIRLINTNEVEDGYIKVLVEGTDGPAPGFKAYSQCIGIPYNNCTLGVRVIGANNHQDDLNWPGEC
jgi:hypothetical protein